MKSSDNYFRCFISGWCDYRLSVFTLICLLWSLALPAKAEDYYGKRIMYIDSYHAELPWSKGITEGIEAVFEGTGINLNIHRMDTKRNRSIEFIQAAAGRARQAIEDFGPDLIIVSDDNAFKHVAQAFYKNADLPLVFCGLNSDAASYGLPYTNTTGMFEVGLVSTLRQQLRPYARGDRIGYLGLDSVSSLKNLERQSKGSGVYYDKVYLIDSFEEWKSAYLALQDEVDMLIVGQQNGIQDWDQQEAGDFVREHTKVPSGSLTPGRMEISLLGYLRSPQEQGQWAATAALKILKGAAPSSIPPAHNEQAVVKINHALSQKLGITFPAALFKRAEILWPYEGRKILTISSYHDDVAWSRKIQETIKKNFARSGVELHTFIMGAKRNRSETHLKKKAMQARQLIENIKPDVVITIDDAAAKYIIAEYYRGSKLPFVFSGVNWDATPYGLPDNNVTGIIEVDEIELLYKQLRRYSKGSRLGKLSEISLTQEKNTNYHRKLFGIEYDEIELVENFEDWKKAFLSLQDRVDMLVIAAPHAIRGWDLDEAIAFVHDNTKIPTGSLTYHTVDLTVMGYVRLPEEHGEWVSQTVFKILDGVAPKDIPLAQNHKGRLVLNRRLLEKLGLVVNRALYRMADIVE